MPQNEMNASDDTFKCFTEAMFERHGCTGPDFNFIQVGTNDGTSGDPLHQWIRKFRWSGMLVEPITPLLDAARITYQNHPNLVFVNAAIADHEGAVTLYSVRDDAGLPKMARLLASLDRRIVLKHAGDIPELRSRIEIQRVPCITLRTLWSRQHCMHLDLFHVDAEGADFDIVRQLDDLPQLPRMLMFEHKHLSDHDRSDAQEWLSGHSYHAVSGRYDTFAYQPAMALERLN